MTTLAGRLTRLERVHRAPAPASVDKAPFDWPAFDELWREVFGDDDPAEEAHARAGERGLSTSP